MYPGVFPELEKIAKLAENADVKVVAAAGYAENPSSKGPV